MEKKKIPKILFFKGDYTEKSIIKSVNISSLENKERNEKIMKWIENQITNKIKVSKIAKINLYGNKERIEKFVQIFQKYPHKENKYEINVLKEEDEKKIFKINSEKLSVLFSKKPEIYKNTFEKIISCLSHQIIFSFLFLGDCDSPSDREVLESFDIQYAVNASGKSPHVSFDFLNFFNVSVLDLEDQDISCFFDDVIDFILLAKKFNKCCLVYWLIFLFVSKLIFFYFFIF